MGSPLYLCATSRLAQHYRESTPTGATVWETPCAFTVCQWLAALAENATLAGLLELPPAIDAAAVRLVWEQAIAASLEGDEAALFDVEGLAATAQEAHTLCQGWHLQPATSEGEETRRFLVWQRAYRRCLAALGRCDEHARDEALLAVLAAGHLDLPERVEFAGFDRHTPHELRLREVLTARGVEVADAVQTQAAAGICTLRMLADSDAECVAAAAWARRLLAESAAARPLRLGIVVPDLAGVRSRLEFALEDALQPQLLRPAAAEAPRLFNFSLGQSLASLPPIRCALDLIALALRPQRVEQTALSQLLHAVYWSSGVTEADARALLDVAMRAELALFTTPAALQRLAEYLVARDEISCPHLLADLRRLLATVRQNGERRRLPSAWAAFFVACLDAARWPGERPLSSHEYQAQATFTECLAAFARLDPLLGAIGAGEASRRFACLCGERVFQPETRGRPPLQVLGTLESSGLEFDALWVMGMNDHLWPPAPRPNPLLPAEAQRRAAAPHASAEVELEFATRVDRRLRRAAPRIVFSCATSDGNRLLRPSPLVAGLVCEAVLAAGDQPGIAADVAGGPVVPAGADGEGGSAALEELDDHLAPPVVAGEVVRGGTWLLRAQAICPAWGYYQFRLGAQALKMPVEGLDAAARGSLVHQVLEQFWTRTSTLEALQALDEAALAAAVEEAVADGLAQWENDRRQSLPEHFRALECVRLGRLLLRWLAGERERSVPFAVVACEQKHEVEIDGIRVRLVADRIDRLADGRELIVDYKTGRSIDTRNWAGDRLSEPQLPIYAAFARGVEAPVAAVAFAKVLMDRPAFAGVAEEGGLLPGVHGLGESKQKLFDGERFPDWPALLAHWRQAILAVAAEIRAGEAAVVFSDPAQLRYCEVLPLLRLAERERQRERWLAIGGQP
jgi:probable DNA repair protein